MADEPPWKRLRPHLLPPPRPPLPVYPWQEGDRQSPLRVAKAYFEQVGMTMPPLPKRCHLLPQHRPPRPLPPTPPSQPQRPGPRPPAYPPPRQPRQPDHPPPCSLLRGAATPPLSEGSQAYFEQVLRWVCEGLATSASANYFTTKSIKIRSAKSIEIEFVSKSKYRICLGLLEIVI